MPQASKESPYSVHPGVILVQNWIAKLPEKTGKSLEDWIQLTKKLGPSGEKERAAWLKKKHKLGTNEAAWIAPRAEGKAIENFDDPETYLQSAQRNVEAMYAGPKAALRPLYERLLQLGRGLGKDVRVSPCKTFVPLNRKHVSQPRRRGWTWVSRLGGRKLPGGWLTRAGSPKATALPTASPLPRSRTLTTT